MAAKVIRLRTRADQLREDQAAQLRQRLLDFPDLPQRAVSEIAAAIDQQTASTNGWTFVMMSPADNAKVVDWLAQNSKRPQIAMRLWAKLFLHLRRDTGEVLQTRDELAEAVGATADHVSTIMGELESIGAISRQRVRIPGMRGPGMVSYFMSPRVGTHLTGMARDIAQDEAPLLRLVETQGG
jgi:hypothetical protein